MIYFGLYLTIFFLPFTFFRFPFNLKISEGIALITIGLIILKNLLSGKEFKIVKTPLFYPMLIIIGVASLTLIQIRLIPSEIYNESWAYGRYSPKWASIIAILRYSFLLCFILLIVNLINRKKILEKTLKIYLLAGGIVSIIGILQMLAYLTGSTELRQLTDLFSKGREGEPLIVTKLPDIGLPRIMGPNNEPKMFANTLLAILPLTIIALLNNLNLYKKKFLFFICVLQIIALLLTFSASGWVFFIISILFMSIVLTKQLIKYTLYTLAITICALPIILFSSRYIPISSGMIYNIQRIYDPFREGMEGQIGPLMSGLKMFEEHPLLGVGIGNFSFHHPEYSGDGYGYTYGVLASNEYVSILAETGLLGAISWLPFIYVFFKLVKFKNLLNHDNFFYSVFIASIAATIGSWGQLWATYGIFNPHIWFPLALAVTAKRLSRYDMKNKG